MSERLDAKELGPEEKTLLEALKEEIFGQDEVLEKIADALGVYRSPLRNLNKPIGVFLFVGPPGVGKMAVVRALAKHLFQDPSGFCYVNCDKPVPLDQRDLDRAHQRMLEKLHKSDMDKLYERGGKLMEEEEELKAMLEKARSLYGDWSNLQGEELAKKKAEFTQSVQQYKKRKIAHIRKDMKLGREMAEAARRGWHYDEDNPPENLLSVAFYDHVENTASDRLDYLAEILDTGRSVACQQFFADRISGENRLA